VIGFGSTARLPPPPPPEVPPTPPRPRTSHVSERLYSSRSRDQLAPNHVPSGSARERENNRWAFYIHGRHPRSEA
jgi:hypothetical protein